MSVEYIPIIMHMICVLVVLLQFDSDQFYWYLSVLLRWYYNIGTLDLWLFDINSLVSGRGGSNFKSIIFKPIIQNIALRWMPQNTFNGMSTLGQVVTWCCQAANYTWLSPELFQHMTSLSHNELSVHITLCDIPRGSLQSTQTDALMQILIFHVCDCHTVTV